MIPLVAFLIPITAHHTQSHLLTSLVPRLNNKVQQRLVVTANMALQDNYGSHSPLLLAINGPAC